MLNVPPEAGPIIISAPLLILFYIVSRQPIKQLSIYGVNLFADKLKSFAVKTGIAILGGSIFFFIPVGVVNLTGALFAGGIILNIANGINNFECNSLLSKVSMERVSQTNSIGFVEILPEKTPNVIIKGNEETEIYVPSQDDNGSCSSEYKKVEVKKSTMLPVKTELQSRIHRKCEREYVPLNERTKTLSDLKKK